MSKKAIWLVTGVMLGLWAVAALLVRAEAIAGTTQGRISAPAMGLLETIPAEPTSTATSEPTIPAEPTATETLEPTRVEVSLSGGPAILCPGYNLYYTLRLTNTSSVQPLTNLVITDMVPLGTWYAVGGLGGTISGTFDSEINAVIWRAAVLNPRQMVEAKLTLHSYSSLRTGTIISNTFIYAATSLGNPGEATVVSVVDVRACPRTNTPTPTHTATRTPTPTHTEVQKATETPTRSPTRWRYYLPLIHKRSALPH